MSQYFEKNPDADHNVKMVKLKYRDEKFKFKTDNAVFSKSRVDFGSVFLVTTLIENEPEMKGKLLDVGCGYGPIATILKRFNEELKLTLIDVNNRALSLAEENLELNGIQNFEILNSDVYQNIDTKFDYIVTNPPIRAGKDKVHEILKESYNFLNAGGILCVVIRKKQGSKSARKALEEVFNNSEIIGRKSGFRVIKCIKGEENE